MLMFENTSGELCEWFYENRMKANFDDYHLIYCKNESVFINIMGKNILNGKIGIY